MARQKYSAYWCSVAAVIFLINVLAISIVGGHGADVPIQMAPSLPIPEHRHPPKKSRQRRFLLPSASGWVARLTFGLFIPVPDVNSVLALTLPLTYTIDTGTFSGRSDDQRLGRRSLSDYESERFELIKGAEKYLAQIAYGSLLNGHECMLRALCEATEVPFHSNGVFGDLFNVLLTPPDVLDHLSTSEVVQSNPYVKAQVQGAHTGNCTTYFRDCPVSLFELLPPEHEDYQHKRT